MAAPSTTAENSLPISVKEQPVEINSEGGPVYKKKPFVYTEGRKKNIVKANLARKEKNDFQKQLKTQYDEATQELHKLYEDKLNKYLSPEVIKTIEESKMSGIKIEPIEKGGSSSSQVGILKKEKNIKIEDAYDSTNSSSEEEMRSKKAGRRKKASKRRAEVQSDSSSDSSDEELRKLREKKLKKKAQLKKKQYYDESESESEAEQAQCSKGNRGGGQTIPSYNRPDMYTGGPRVGQNSGCHF